ncbi:MAG: MBL fold metallo-hydrolase [Desulfatitalea sp.]|nr:MBL fold metallo-hydrolase [Desulfatitalea sp.]NNK00358.1 MBL fold metallo-hydrolase [Desulfatitalea sp.]
MQLSHQSVGPWAMNAYSLTCPHTQKSVLIDPGAAPFQLMRLIENSTPIAILLTHDHPDHVGALDEMRRKLMVPVVAHQGPGGRSAIHADHWLTAGEYIDVGDHRLITYPTPGHTDDQVSFGVENIPIFIVGDTIFEGGPGKTWSPEGFQETLDTLRNVVLHWPDDAICHPGHGPSFRLGDKRKAIERFVAKNHGNFFGDAHWEM